MENSAKGATSQKLVMLVDDSTIDNFVNQKIIERNSFSKTIITFTKAGKALEYLSEIDEQQDDISAIPSIIFLDLNMPLINGFEFLEIYNKLSTHIKSRCKIVILTSSVNPVDILQFSENKNVLTFIHKPLIQNNFSEIEKLLEKRPSFI